MTAEELTYSSWEVVSPGMTWSNGNHSDEPVKLSMYTRLDHYNMLKDNMRTIWGKFDNVSMRFAREKDFYNRLYHNQHVPDAMYARQCIKNESIRIKHRLNNIVLISGDIQRNIKLIAYSLLASNKN